MAEGQPLPPGSVAVATAGVATGGAIARIGLSLGPFGRHRQDEAK